MTLLYIRRFQCNTFERTFDWSNNVSFDSIEFDKSNNMEIKLHRGNQFRVYNEITIEIFFSFIFLFWCIIFWFKPLFLICFRALRRRKWRQSMNNHKKRQIQIINNKKWRHMSKTHLSRSINWIHSSLAADASLKRCMVCL